MVRSLPDSICSDPAGSAARRVQRDGELSSSWSPEGGFAVRERLANNQQRVAEGPWNPGSLSQGQSGRVKTSSGSCLLSLRLKPPADHAHASFRRKGCAAFLEVPEPLLKQSSCLDPLVEMQSSG